MKRIFAIVLTFIVALSVLTACTSAKDKELVEFLNGLDVTQPEYKVIYIRGKAYKAWDNKPFIDADLITINYFTIENNKLIFVSSDKPKDGWFYIKDIVKVYKSTNSGLWDDDFIWSRN